MTEFNTDLDDEIEIDFSATPDRYAQHLDGSDPDEVEVPPYWESDKDIHELYSPDSLDKAFKLVRSNRVKSAGREGLYQVEGSDLYVCTIVELDDSVVPGVTCTCPNGSNRTGRPTCYHSAAVLMVHTGQEPGDVEMKLANMGIAP